MFLDSYACLLATWELHQVDWIEVLKEESSTETPKPETHILTLPFMAKLTITAFYNENYEGGPPKTGIISWSVGPL